MATIGRQRAELEYDDACDARGRRCVATGQKGSVPRDKRDDQKRATEPWRTRSATAQSADRNAFRSYPTDS